MELYLNEEKVEVIEKYFCLINFDISPKTAITNRCMLYMCMSANYHPQW